jgi:hypothetical protein
MGNVRVYYGEGAPPARGQISPAPPPSYLTQDERAAAGFGQALTQTGAMFLEHIQKVDVDNQLSEFEGSVTESYGTFLSELAQDPEPSMYLSKYKEYTDKVTKDNLETIKNPAARRAAKNWFKKQSASWSSQVQDKATSRVMKNAEDALELAEYRAVQNRDPELINREATRALQNGIIGENEAALILEQSHNAIAYGEINDLIRVNPEAALAEIEASPMITTEQKRQLEYYANRRIRQLEAQEKLAQDKQTEQIEIGYLARLKKEELLEDDLMADLQAGKIDTDLYKEYSNYVDAQVRERLKGKEPEPNFNVYDSLHKMVTDFQNGITTDERKIRDNISDAVKKGDITWSNGTSFLTNLRRAKDPEDPLNRTSAKRALGFLTELKNNDFFWPDDAKNKYEGKKQNGIKHLKLSNELEQWITANPDATDDEITEKADKLTQPFIEQQVTSRLERALDNIGKVWWQFGIAKNAVNKLRNKKKTEDLSELSDEELEAIIKGE